MRLVEGLERVWGVRLVAGIVRDHVELVDEYYFCELRCARWGEVADVSFKIRQRETVAVDKVDGVERLVPAQWTVLVLCCTMMHCYTFRASVFIVHCTVINLGQSSIPRTLYFLPSCASANATHQY